MTGDPLNYNGGQVIGFPSPQPKEPAKTLADFPWDMELGKPHGFNVENVQANVNDLARYKDVTNPDHYKKGDVEVIQLTEKLGFCEGNIVKYVARYKDKGGKDDLLKARWYLDRLITRYEESTDADHYHGC